MTIRTQNDLIVSLQKMLEDRNAKDDEKDRIISNLQAQLEYFKQKLFGNSSERRSDLPGQLSIYSGSEEEPLPELIEPEFIEVKTSKRERKTKADYDEMFANLPIHYEEVNTLSEEDKQCPACGCGMIPLGHEEIRTELRYTRAKLERVVYIATTYGCLVCKDTEDPQFIKDEGIPHLSPADMLLLPSYHISCMKNMQMRFLCTGRKRDLNFLESVSAERPWRAGSSPAPRTI